MRRREFIKTAGAAGLGIAIGSRISLGNALEAESRPDLAVVTGKTPSAITRRAIEALGGIGRFIKKGETVVVKPNMAWDRTPELAANTNPEVVAEVVRLCFEAGAKKVKVFDRPVNDPRRCYVQSGIASAVEALGAECPYMDTRRFLEVKIEGGIALKRWPLYKDILDADAIINVPIAKHHGLAGLTMAMKNWMGVIGGNRSMIHQKLDESLADLLRVIRPRLTVLDAVRVLTANGPQGGNPSDVKRLDTVVAGVDQVSVDAFGATLFGKKASDLEYLMIAGREGLGMTDLSRLKIERIAL